MPAPWLWEIFSLLINLSPPSRFISIKRGGQTTRTEPAEPGKLLPADGASVKILSPTTDQIFQKDQIPLEFRIVKGKRGHHVHAYVNGELMGMFNSRKGTLTGLKPGKHVLELRVVAEDHKSELDAIDKVSFVVK